MLQRRRHLFHFVDLAAQVLDARAASQIFTPRSFQLLNGQSQSYP